MTTDLTLLGIELMSRLDPEPSEAESAFDMMANVANLIETFAPALGAGLVTGQDRESG